MRAKQGTSLNGKPVLGAIPDLPQLISELNVSMVLIAITHADCTRYFMTIPEAVGLVLLAGLGGYGDLCVLDMGEPIKIAQLARNLITMAGRVPGQDIPIVFTGLRPGEKLFEELLTIPRHNVLLVGVARGGLLGA